NDHRKNTILNAKHFAGKNSIFSYFQLLLYINHSPTLPSLCEASHKIGYGEHLEQQPIRTDEGDLYVSFWNSGDDYRIMERDELDGFIDAQNFTMGGM
ncbi:MAG: hypothetical protein IKZ82_00500, partial [Clostridia bacterium]|nr:hypothetical protein [Clostridia bacterium]